MPSRPVVALGVAIVASSANLVVPSPAAAHDPGAAVAAGTIGFVGGLMLGGALAAPPPPPPADVVVVRRRPVRIIEQEEVVVPARCWREEWRDRWGDIHFRRICR
jgi:hypothetical protein